MICNVKAWIGKCSGNTWRSQHWHDLSENTLNSKHITPRTDELFMWSKSSAQQRKSLEWREALQTISNCSADRGEDSWLYKIEGEGVTGCREGRSQEVMRGWGERGTAFAWKYHNEFVYFARELKTLIRKKSHMYLRSDPPVAWP